MDTVAATKPSTCTIKGREEWDEKVQGVGEKICHVEIEGHARFGQEVEDGGNNGGEETNEGRIKEGERGSGADRESHQATKARGDFQSGTSPGKQGVG